MSRAKEWFVRAGFAIAAITAALPLRDIETSQRAVDALLGDEVGCADSVEPANPAYPFDAIAVLGAGQLPGPNGQPEPSYFGAMRLEAAARLYAEGVAPFIIVVNGNGAAAEIAYLQQAYQRITRSKTPIADEAILVGNHAINTVTEMEEVAAIARTHNIQLIGVDTNGFHTPRATIILCGNGLAALPFPAEEVLQEYAPERREEFEALYDSPMMVGIQAKETAELLLLIVDPVGEIPTGLRRIFPSP